MESESNVDGMRLRQSISNQINVFQERQKAAFNAHRKKSVTFDKENFVLVKISSIVSTGKSRTLIPKWKGPFRIAKVLEYNCYQVTPFSRFKPF